MTSLSLGVRYAIVPVPERAPLFYVEAAPGVFFGQWTIGRSTWSDSMVGVQANVIIPVVVRDSFSLEAGCGVIHTENVRLPDSGSARVVSFRYVQVFGGFSFDLQLRLGEHANHADI